MPSSHPVRQEHKIMRDTEHDKHLPNKPEKEAVCNAILH